MAGVYNITHRQGDTFNLALVYSDSAGDPINLTGFTAKCQLRANASSDTAVLTATTSDGTLVITGAQGRIAFAISATAMGAIAAGTYVYDLEIESSGGVVTTILTGTFTITPEVTR